MRTLTRRQLIKDAFKVAAALGLGGAMAPQVAEALESLARGNPPVLWLQGQSCSGCSVALLNSTAPGPAELLTRYISLLFHPNLSAAAGDMAEEVLSRTIARGGFILAVEGSLPAKMPRACTLGSGHKPVADWVAEAAARALAVVCVGTCASHGGIPAAERNPTGALAVGAYLKSKGIERPTINIPGCPSHPEWVVSTLACVAMGLNKGRTLEQSLPPLDEQGRPKAFFGRMIHDQCPRFPDYERELFAESFDSEGCLFKLGCVGPRTPGDCTMRLWNNGANMCIKAGGPCIGCTRPEFAMQQDFPFYQQKLERDKLAGGTPS